MEISGRRRTAHDAAPLRAREDGPRCLESAPERRHPWHCHGVGRMSFGAVVHGFNLAFGRLATLSQQNVRHGQLKATILHGTAFVALRFMNARCAHPKQHWPLVGIPGPFSKVLEFEPPIAEILIPAAPIAAEMSKFSLSAVSILPELADLCRKHVNGRWRQRRRTS
jgi:hypothetical protein